MTHHIPDSDGQQEHNGGDPEFKSQLDLSYGLTYGLKSLTLGNLDDDDGVL